METIEYNFIDKTEWNRGEWDHEPDKVQWQDKETGLPCLAVRNSSAGFWCGYVGVDSKHPYFEKKYDDCDVDCHCGLTFSGKCGNNEHGICHKVSEGEDDNVWWLGFDCGHCDDMSPGYSKLPYMQSFMHGAYRTLDYVKLECASMARQLTNPGQGDDL